MATVSEGGGQATRRVKTAGIIIIGDEILKGQVLDANTFYLCKELYSWGVKVGKISVVADVIDSIAEEVRDFSGRFDFVLTTGGIGPTHDDMTYAAVAKAFSQSVTMNTDMATLIEKWLGHKGYSREVIMKMAQMPSNAELIFEPGKHLESFPIVTVHNVYVFPGIPSYVKRMFPRLEATLRSTSHHFHNRQIFVARDEMSITPQLNEAVEKFKEHVIFGSYPITDNLYFSTRLTMEADTNSHVDDAQQFLTSILPSGSVVDYDAQPLITAAEKVYAMVDDTDHVLHETVRVAVLKIEEALEKYTLENMCICFNGGKDCTVLLHLFYAVVHRKFGGSTKKLPTLCIKNENSFVEMEDFIAESVERYNLNLWRYESTILSGLRSALTEHPEIKAVLMGTRRSDPSGIALSYFQMTDSSWPQVMRVSPMLDWTYAQIWEFLRGLTLPYCSLYDRGAGVQ